MIPRFAPRRCAAALALVVLAAAVCGCARRADLRFHAIDNGAVLSPRYTTVIYRHQDENTLDIMLSDLPLEFLLRARPEEIAQASGTLVHIHQFFAPFPGRTALRVESSNATVRHVVFAGGEVGVYGGGGLVRTGSTAGGASLRVRVDGGTTRLIESTPGFADRLGAATFSGALQATRDDAATETLTRLVQRVLATTGGA